MKNRKIEVSKSNIIFSILLLINLGIWIFYIHSVRFFNWNKASIMWGFIQVFISVAIVAFMVLKPEKKSRCRVFGISILVLVLTVVTLFFPFFTGIESVTTDTDNYLCLDKRVEEQIEKNLFPFPNKLNKEKVKEIQYNYKFIKTLDDEAAIFLAQTYKEKEDYLKEKERILNNYTIVYESNKGPQKIVFTVYSTSRDIFCIFYDEEKTIRYGYYSFNMMEDVENYFEL